MGDKRWSSPRGGGGAGGEGGGGTWNFFTKTLPSVTGFVTTVASKWLHEQDMLEEQERDAELESEIQGQISKISELLREQERPLARDGTRNLDMEIQHQLARIQGLLVETKRRGGGRISDSDLRQMRMLGRDADHFAEARSAGASVHSDGSGYAPSQTGGSRNMGGGGGSGRKQHYADISIDTSCSPALTPQGSDGAWPSASVSGLSWTDSQADSPHAYGSDRGGGAGGGHVSHHSTPHRPQQGERRVPASASARLGGGSGNMSPHMHPESNSAARAALQASALGAARESGSARRSGRGLEESDDYHVYGEDPARQLFQSQSPGVGGGGKGWRALTSREVAEQDELKTLFSRARHGRYKDVEAMLETGISADVRNEFGNTLLMIAAQNGNKRIVKICLRRRCNINARNFRGQTALHYAFAFGYTELGEYLESKGADSSLRNEYGLAAREGLEPKEAVVSMTDGRGAEHAWGSRRSSAWCDDASAQERDKDVRKERRRERPSGSQGAQRRNGNDDSESLASQVSSSTAASAYSGHSFASSAVGDPHGHDRQGFGGGMRSDVSADSFASSLLDFGLARQGGGQAREDEEIPDPNDKGYNRNLPSQRPPPPPAPPPKVAGGSIMAAWENVCHDRARAQADGGDAGKGRGDVGAVMSAEVAGDSALVRDGALLSVDNTEEEECSTVSSVSSVSASHLAELALAVRKQQAQRQVRAPPNAAAQGGGEQQARTNANAAVLASPPPPLLPPAPLAANSRQFSWRGGLLGRHDTDSQSLENEGDGEAAMAATFPPFHTRSAHESGQHAAPRAPQHLAQHQPEVVLEAATEPCDLARHPSEYATPPTHGDDPAGSAPRFFEQQPVSPAAGSGDAAASVQGFSAAAGALRHGHSGPAQRGAAASTAPTAAATDAGVHEQTRSLPPAPAATPPIAAPTGVRAGLNTPGKQSAAGLSGGFTPMPPNTPPPPHVKPVAGFASPAKSGCSSPGGIAASPHGPGGGEAFATNLSVNDSMELEATPPHAHAPQRPAAALPRTLSPSSTSRAKWLDDEESTLAGGSGAAAPPPTPLNAEVPTAAGADSRQGQRMSTRTSEAVSDSLPDVLPKDAGPSSLTAGAEASESGVCEAGERASAAAGFETDPARWATKRGGVDGRQILSVHSAEPHTGSPHGARAATPKAEREVETPRMQGSPKVTMDDIVSLRSRLAAAAGEAARSSSVSCASATPPGSAGASWGAETQGGRQGLQGQTETDTGLVRAKETGAESVWAHDARSPRKTAVGEGAVQGLSPVRAAWGTGEDQVAMDDIHGLVGGFEPGRKTVEAEVVLADAGDEIDETVIDASDVLASARDTARQMDALHSRLVSARGPGADVAESVRGGIAAVAEDLEPLPSISLASKAPKAVYDKNAISDDEDSDE